MRQFRLLIFLLALGLAAAPVLRAQDTDPSDLFLSAYMSVQKAQKQEEAGKFKLALQTYKYAATLLEQIRDKSPDWQPVIVNFRLGKTSEAIALLEKKIEVMGPGPMNPEPPLPVQDNPGVSSSTPAPSVNTPSGGDAVDQVRDEIQRMKEELDEWKKKYASEHEQNIQLTQKVADTLKQLDQARVDYAQTRAQLEQAEQDYKNSVADKTRDVEGQKALKDEIARLQDELKQRDAERDAAQDANDEAREKIATIGSARDQAVKERDDAVEALSKAKEGQQQVDKLMADNAALKAKLNEAEKTIADLNANNPAKDAQIASLKKDLADANDRLADALKQSQENLNAMHDLQDQLETATTNLSQAKTGGANSEETKKLADENELLRGIVKLERNEEAYRDQQKQIVLDELNKLHVPSDSAAVASVNDLARPLKLTDAQRALFRQMDISISDNNVSISAERPTDANAGPSPAPSATPVTETAPPLPAATPAPATAAASPSPSPSPAAATAAASPVAKPSSASHTTFIPAVPEALVPQARQAKEAFEHGQYRDAEKIYRAMMEQEPENLYILDNLGVVLFRSGKLKEAEQILRKALAATPDDEFTLRTLGIVLYTEGSFDGDGALSKLTRAVDVNPKDAIARNYLGITASAKGWQEAARSELEKAVAIDPNYADAQFNLAVIYLTTAPVDKESARKHYKRALEDGANPDPAFEQLLDKADSSSSSPPSADVVKH